MCSICLQDKPYIELRSLQCRHLACLDCWTGYFKAKIDDDSDADRITCPTLNCDLLVDDSIIHSTLSPNSPTLRRFNKLISNSFVSANPCLTWCPGADCGWAANSTLGLRSMVKVECPHCNESFCCGCGWSWHDPVKCDRLLAWATKESLDSGTYSWIMSHTKDCPKCHFSIEKNGGCNHMTCKNPSCKYEFCWLCLGAWAPHGSNWNKCNRFEQEAGQKARQAQAESRVSYERYLFYFNRYINHKQSLGFEAQLTARVSDKVAVMQSCNLGTSWMEVKFLNNVVHILCSCRRTLMYTYVFAYYLRPNNQSTIFESNQYDLEQAAEQLSELLERDWAHLGLNDLKQPLQDKARYCDRRRQVLLDHVHEGYANDWWDCVTDDDLS